MNDKQAELLAYIISVICLGIVMFLVSIVYTAVFGGNPVEVFFVFAVVFIITRIYEQFQ